MNIKLSEREKTLIHNAMLFAVKDITSRVLRNETIETMVDDFIKDLNKQIINIGPDEEFVTINKIAELCSNITGKNLPPIYKPDRPREVKHATCSADKARKLLNYKTLTSLEDGIRKTYEYIKKRGVRPFDYNIDIEINNELTPTTWTKKEI